MWSCTSDSRLTLHTASRLNTPGTHIHHTFRLETGQEAQQFLLQRLNVYVFPDLEAVMSNIQRISTHLAQQLPSSRNRLTLRLTKKGEPIHFSTRQEGGGAWRVFDYIGGSVSHDVLQELSHVEAAARAYGEYQRRLATLPPPPLKDALPGK